MTTGSQRIPVGALGDESGRVGAEARPMVVFNALASTAGGGITYLRNVVPRLSALSESFTFTVLVDARVGPQLIAAGLDSRNVLPVSVPRWGWSRVLWEQRYLRRFCRRSRADVLVSLGNFACLGSPVPQVLFNRSDLFYSPEFRVELWRRRRFGMLLGNEVRGLLSRFSVHVADVNVAPTRAFADRLRATRSLKNVAVRVLPFGFDPAAFTADKEGLSEEDLRKLRVGEDVCRIVMVSHYNYFRNFETLLRALPLIKEHSSSPVLLVLTTRLARGLRDGVYDTTLAARLAERLGITRDLVMLGRVPYSKVHHLLAHCDIFVLPSFSETFGHPMVEAMASGLPVVAADLPVHREVCGDAALYFPVFDQQALAERCVRLLQDRELHEGLRQHGLARAQQFSWDKHVRGLKAVIESCIAQPEKAGSAEPRQAVQARAPLSVLIPARNDAVNLERCLAPLQGWADEVVVVDSGSADDTASIARRYGASVVQFEYRGGWPKKRQWALDTVPLRNGWVLLLDADEILDEAVKAEISGAIERGGVDGYWVRFNMVFLGRPLRFGGTALWKLCLFRRGRGRYELRLADQDSSMADIEVHEHVLVDGPVGRLFAAVRHENVSSLDRYIAKHNEYSNWEAAVLLEGLDGGVRPTLFGNQAQRRRWLKRAFTGVPGSPLALFLLKYVLQLGFLDGKPGLIYCWLQAVQLFHTKAKLHELERAKARRYSS